MKFSNLSSASRSMLAALCASVGSGLSTYQLGKAVSPQLDPQAAAKVLMDLRAKGLVYSHQKPVGQSYCMWHASDYGQAVFNGRPNDVFGVEQAPSPQPQSTATTVYMVVNADGKPAVSWVPHADSVELLEDVQRYLTSHPGHPELTVIEQKVRRIAVVTAPPKPEAQITLL